MGSFTSMAIRCNRCSMGRSQPRRLPISPASADRFINALNQVAEELRSGRELSSLDAVSGGTPGENAGAVRDVLAGASGPTRDIVTLNAAAGLLAAGAAAVIAGGLEAAGRSIDWGAAERALEALIDISNA